MAKVRSTSNEEKAAKREHIKKCALNLYSKSGKLCSVDKIVKESGVAKGTFYLYFKTKEEVFLDILSDKYAAYLQQVFEELNDGVLTFEVLAEALVDPLVEDKDFLRLAAIGPSILEKNVSEEKIIEFKLMLMQAMGSLVDVFQALIPELEVKSAAQLVVTSFSLIIGVFQQSGLTRDLKELRERPELKSLFIDFETMTSRSLVSLWRGWLLT
ncbi:MAG: TetR family transcriptional regulator [Bacteriovoracaceae bacterium]|nr:TetR family transcriptional regulator [Bacteriovoracaceae bacterium]